MILLPAAFAFPFHQAGFEGCKKHAIMGSNERKRPAPFCVIFARQCGGQPLVIRILSLGLDLGGGPDGPQRAAHEMALDIRQAKACSRWDALLAGGGDCKHASIPSGRAPPWVFQCWEAKALMSERM